MTKIPRWILDERHKVCAACDQMKSCQFKYQIMNEKPQCPLGKLKTYQDLVAERAWPSGATRVSGCCDSAMNYGD